MLHVNQRVYSDLWKMYKSAYYDNKYNKFREVQFRKTKDKKKNNNFFQFIFTIGEQNNKFDHV